VFEVEAIETSLRRGYETLAKAPCECAAVWISNGRAHGKLTTEANGNRPPEHRRAPAYL
jgi:hypothetical protein